MENLDEFEIWPSKRMFQTTCDEYKCSKCDWKSPGVVYQFINKFNGTLVRYSCPVCGSRAEYIPINISEELFWDVVVTVNKSLGSFKKLEDISKNIKSRKRKTT